MGIFGATKKYVPPHPRKDPQFPLPLTTESIQKVFENCVDYTSRTLCLHHDPEKTVTLCYIGGMVRLERACDYVLRPLTQSEAFRDADMDEAYRLMRTGAIYDLAVKECTTVDGAVSAMIDGDCLLLFPGERALAFMTGTEEKRSVTPPENEPAVKGAKDSFVESLRTNTSLVRRRLRAPTLKVEEHVVGRQSKTPVDVLYLTGIADPETVAQVGAKLDAIDINALLASGNLEQYLTGEKNTAFPLIPYTQRPDRFCAGLSEGRVGLLVDGLPVGYLLPGSLDQFFKTEQDKSDNWMVASTVAVLRYLCVLVTLLLPALYVAAVLFHPEMIPTRLALSIIAAKADVPFSALFEVLMMLVAFEVLQEAGLRLPASIGQTVSILGGLVVGSAAVEAKIVSPAVLIVVALAGIAGYTMPSPDFAGALRLWRFLLAVAGGLGGLLGVVLGSAVLLFHLAGLESFGVPYLTPFAAKAGDQVEGETVLREPLPAVKYRPASLKTKNRRQQK